MTSPFGASAFYTTSSMISAILKKSGFRTPSSETVNRERILNDLNARYLQILKGRDWRFLTSYEDFNLIGPYETGTVSLTEGSTSVVGVDTFWNVSLLYDTRFIIGSRSEDYEVKTIDSSTMLTLGSEYVGETESDLEYKIVRGVYEMPSDVESVMQFSVDGLSTLQYIGYQDLEIMKRRRGPIVGAPQYYSMYEVKRLTDSDAPDGDVVKINVFPYPDRAYQCHIVYKKRVVPLEDSDSSFAFIPDNYRDVLYYAGLADFYMSLKNIEGFNAAMKDYNYSFMRMAADTNLTDQNVKIVPKRNYPRIRRRLGLRISYSPEEIT